MKKMLKKKEELLFLLDEVKCADSEYDYKLQTINEIEYQLYLLEEEMYDYEMMKPLKYMLYGFIIASIVLITYAIFA
jgi:hypothetical protein